MLTRDECVRYADECEAMNKIARHAENRVRLTEMAAQNGASSPRPRRHPLNLRLAILPDWVERQPGMAHDEGPPAYFFASRIVRHRRSGVAGMSKWRTP
jgi:hypothetical protein